MRLIPGRPAAVAHIRGNRGSTDVFGTVRFYQLPGGILVEADISGLPKNSSGFYGFHIHEGAACSGVNFSATGGHFSPNDVPHPRHAGDLPPLLSNSGRAYLVVLTDRFSLSDVMGRTVVVHSNADDFHSQPAGNAGEKIACGTIQRNACRSGGY